MQPNHFKSHRGMQQVEQVDLHLAQEHLLIDIDIAFNMSLLQHGQGQQTGRQLLIGRLEYCLQVD
jgi:hypothetical protein